MNTDIAKFEPALLKDGTMAKMMKVAVMTANNKVELTERPVPTPAADEALVRLEYVGVCGSDLHLYEHFWGKTIHEPYVLGHEAAGVVVEVGKDVKNLKAGDRVALEPGKTCGKCEFCKSGRYNLCPDVIFFATPPVEGVFQEYVAHEAALCFKLPENVSTLEGALIEPLAVGFHAANQGGAHPGQTAVVTGAGCIGLVSLMALKISGVSKIYVLDVMDNRLEKAMELGATGVINSKKEDPVKKVMELTNGMGADLVIDTAGVADTVNQGIEYAKKGATIVLVGYNASGHMDIKSTLLTDKEITIKTVFRYRNIYPMAIESVAAGLVDLKGIVSNIYDLDDIQEGLQASVKNKANLVKAVIKIT